jgi:hypothetical protein
MQPIDELNGAIERWQRAQQAYEDQKKAQQRFKSDFQVYRTDYLYRQVVESPQRTADRKRDLDSATYALSDAISRLQQENNPDTLFRAGSLLAEVRSEESKSLYERGVKEMLNPDSGSKEAMRLADMMMAADEEVALKIASVVNDSDLYDFKWQVLPDELKRRVSPTSTVAQKVRVIRLLSHDGIFDHREVAFFIALMDDNSAEVRTAAFGMLKYRNREDLPDDYIQRLRGWFKRESDSDLRSSMSYALEKQDTEPRTVLDKLTFRRRWAK